MDTSKLYSSSLSLSSPTRFQSHIYKGQYLGALASHRLSLDSSSSTRGFTPVAAGTILLLTPHAKDRSALPLSLFFSSFLLLRWIIFNWKQQRTTTSEKTIIIGFTEKTEGPVCNPRAAAAFIYSRKCEEETKKQDKTLWNICFAKLAPIIVRLCVFSYVLYI